MTDGAWQLTLRDLQRIYTSPRWLAGLAAVALVLGLSGPFGTFALPLAARLAYWAAVVFLTWGAGIAGGNWAAHRFGHRLRHPLPRIAALALAAGVPVVAVVLGLNSFVFAGSDLAPRGDPWLGFYVLAIVLAIVTLSAVLHYTAGPAPADEAAAPALLRRLDGPKRGRLLSLSVQDHYVEVVTDKGSSLVLMRLSDAIAETAPVAGVRIHRSHWVALDAVTDVGRRGGGATVTLRDGRELPVSRGQMAEARAAGLIA